VNCELSVSYIGLLLCGQLLLSPVGQHCQRASSTLSIEEKRKIKYGWLIAMSVAGDEHTRC
jgi:hypothetical protein